MPRATPRGHDAANVQLSRNGGREVAPLARMSEITGDRSAARSRASARIGATAAPLPLAGRRSAMRPGIRPRPTAGGGDVSLRPHQAVLHGVLVGSAVRLSCIAPGVREKRGAGAVWGMPC